MNHLTNSKTFEKDYDEAEYDLHVTAIALSEDLSAGAQSLRDDSSPALFRTTIPPSCTSIHKAFVELLVPDTDSRC